MASGKTEFLTVLNFAVQCLTHLELSGMYSFGADIFKESADMRSDGSKTLEACLQSQLSSLHLLLNQCLCRCIL